VNSLLFTVLNANVVGDGRQCFKARNFSRHFGQEGAKKDKMPLNRTRFRGHFSDANHHAALLSIAAVKASRGVQ
jgi:hypothetical protein